MAERVCEKIAFAFFIVLMAGTSACAKEEFVPYSQAMPQEPVPAAPPETPEAGSISQEQLLEKLNKKEPVILFDARQKSEYDKERMVGAKLPRSEKYYQEVLLYQNKVTREAPSSKTYLEAGTKDIPRDTQIVTYCHAHCGLSKTLKLDLESLGFTHVTWLDGGIDVWREKGYPLDKATA